MEKFFLNKETIENSVNTLINFGLIKFEKNIKKEIYELRKPSVSQESSKLINEWSPSSEAIEILEMTNINQEFLSLVDNAYKTIGLSSSDITKKSYQNKLENIKDDDDSIRKEVQSVSRRITEIKQEIIQLETNLQFFGKNQDKNPIVIKVREDIAKNQKRLAGLEEKKRLVKSLTKG